MIIDRSRTTQCLFCRFSSASRPSGRRKQLSGKSTRAQSTTTSALHAREELRTALKDLEKHARSYVNLSQLQLALRGLEQTPGQETIRVGVIGLTSRSASTTKELVRLLVADPLSQEEDCERQLLASAEGRPLLVKITSESDQVHVARRLMEELQVSSPMLNGHNLEILLLQADGTGEDVLVPTVEVQASNTRYTPVTTPIHMAVVVGDGILGAAELLKLDGGDNMFPAVNMSGVVEDLPLKIIDVSLAERALAAFRQSIDNAMLYEQDWFKSGLSSIREFIKSRTAADAVLKAPVRSLVSSIVADSTTRIAASEQAQLASLLSRHVSTSSLQSLKGDLEAWAHRAHTELRDTLETAFAGRKWRKLGWWKLFWRVDDVSMISSSILYQRFLPEAEKEVIFLSGKIEEAGVNKTNMSTTASDWAYKPAEKEERVVALGRVAPDLEWSDVLEKREENLRVKSQSWPQDIPIARKYLLLDTIPALQALAQKLVLQTLSTSGFAGVFSTLIYLADSSMGLYEAGTVVALGTVWSMRRMQTKWEKAREYWEAEVREEGRRSIRAVEGSIEDVLKEPVIGEIEAKEELDTARRAIERVEKALIKVNESI